MHLNIINLKENVYLSRTEESFMGKKQINQTLYAPVVRETDVLIVGGGSAGWSAAIAAARCGVKVILVERNYELGGTSTTAMMHLFGAPSSRAPSNNQYISLPYHRSI